MAEKPGGESPYESVPVTITAPVEGQTITTKQFDIKGTAPAGEVVKLMEVMQGGQELWSHSQTTAAPDNTFVFEKLSNGTGTGDCVNHIIFVMVGGDVPHKIVTRGRESQKVHFYYKPEGLSN